MSQKTITEYEIIDHGIDGASYFPGCGLSYTKFDDAATGNGDTFNEALDDALEQLALQGWNVDGATRQDGKFAPSIAKAEMLSDGQNEMISASNIVRAACDCEECEDDSGVIDCQGDCDCAENAETYYYVSIRVR